MYYGPYEDTLVALHQIEEADMGAFKSKLRFYRDMGMPTTDRPGTGAKATYSVDALWEAHLALVLSEGHLLPSVVKKIVTKAREENWRELTIKQIAANEPSLFIVFSGDDQGGIELMPLGTLSSALRSNAAAMAYSVLSLSRITRDIQAKTSN